MIIFPSAQGAHFRPYLIEWMRFSIPPPCMQGGTPRAPDKQLQAGSSEETPEETPDPALVFSVSPCLSGEKLCYGTIHRFSAKGHSRSIHWASTMKPAVLAMRPSSAEVNLCDDSLQMLSPRSNCTLHPAAGMVTSCTARTHRCISMRRSLGRQRA